MQNIGTHKSKLQRLKYIVADVVSSLLAWFLFFLFRRIEIESTFIQEIQLFSPVYNFEKLLMGIPLYWLFVFWLSGYYNQPFLKSRLEEFGQTLVSTFLGSIGLFFILLLDDPVVNYTDYYLSFSVLFAIYFVVVYIFRYTLTRISTYNIHHRLSGFNTLIIGTGEKGNSIYQDLCNQKYSTGEMVLGFVSTGQVSEEGCKELNVLGDISQLDDIIRQYAIEEVIVALDGDDKSKFFDVVNQLFRYNVDVRLIPRLYDFLVGGVRLNVIYGAPLVSLLEVRMSECAQNVKRLFDIVASLLALLLTSPMLLVVACAIKLTSDGPVFYKQQRVGFRSRLFDIYKFRTMVVDSEGGKPQLSSKEDKRVTKVGKVLRKYRIDEIPQFYNVLRGDMSIVGPRPERPYFEALIEEKAPYYALVHKVRPGITSWGMVKYGYADSVEKMVERLNYDIIYLENMSISVDLKILIYTIRTVLTGQGV